MEETGRGSIAEAGELARRPDVDVVPTAPEEPDLLHSRRARPVGPNLRDIQLAILEPHGKFSFPDRRRRRRRAPGRAREAHGLARASPSPSPEAPDQRSQGSFRSRYSSTVIADMYSSNIACSSAGIPFCSPARASASEVK